MRATRRLDELIKAQKETVGLNQGAAGGGKKDGPRGSLVNPRDERPTLAEAGIGKNLAHQARVLGAMSEQAFERKVAEARDSAVRVFGRTVREVEVAQERRARTATGGSVADLEAPIASGFRAGVIALDCPWPFDTYNDRSPRVVESHFEPMTIEEIKALPVRRLAADDCAILMWATWPLMPKWAPVLEAWGVEYSGLGFELDGDGTLHAGGGINSRQNPEPRILAKVGAPLRLRADVDAVIMAKARGVRSEARPASNRRPLRASATRSRACARPGGGHDLTDPQRRGSPQKEGPGEPGSGVDA
jgi:N6-adenosine-specific RNA methylase IME4